MISLDLGIKYTHTIYLHKRTFQLFIFFWDFVVMKSFFNKSLLKMLFLFFVLKWKTRLCTELLPALKCKRLFGCGSAERNTNHGKNGNCIENEVYFLLLWSRVPYFLTEWYRDLHSFSDNHRLIFLGGGGMEGCNPEQVFNTCMKWGSHQRFLDWAIHPNQPTSWIICFLFQTKINIKLPSSCFQVLTTAFIGADAVCAS